MRSSAGITSGGGAQSKKRILHTCEGDITIPYYKCVPGQVVTILIEKWRITRQNVYTLNYIN